MKIQHTLEKRKDSPFYMGVFRLYDDNEVLIKRIRISTKVKTQSLAFEFCRQKAKEIAANGFKDIKSDRVLFKDYALEWVSNLEYKRGTILSKENSINNHIIPVIGNTQIVGLVRDQIKELDRALIAKGLVKSSRANHLYVAGQILNHSVEDGIRQFNPMAGYSPVTTREEREAVPKEIVPYSKDECSRYVRSALDLYGIRKEQGMGCIILLCTGIRIGEMLGLKRNNVLFSDKKTTLEIRQQYSRHEKNTFTSLKTKSSRRDIFTPYILFNCDRILKEYIMANGNRRSRLFTLSRETYAYHHRRIIEKAKLHYLSPHRLRTTYASLVANRTSNIKNLQRILGHSKIDMTINIYVKFVEDDVKRDYESMKDLHSLAM